MSVPNAIILGATGFVGRNLVKFCVDKGIFGKIRCVDKVFPQTAFLSAEHAACYERPNVEFMQGNLLNKASIEKCFTFAEGKFNFVFNCAAETKYSQDVDIYKDTTLRLVTLVCTQAKANGCDKIIHLSSCQIYKPDKKQSKEDAKLEPWTNMAVVQLLAEEEIKKSGVPFVILRPSTIYGPGDTTGVAPRVICAAVYKRLDEKMKYMWGGDLRINTVHVRDVCAAMVHAATTIPAGSIFNVSDKSDTDQEKINKILEQIFNISTGFVGSIMSKMAKMNFKAVTEDVNDKHMKPWSDLCKEAGIVNTPLTPYLDQELLYNNHLAVDGSAIEKTGFTYAHPSITKDLVMEIITYFRDQGLFPFKE